MFRKGAEEKDGGKAVRENCHLQTKERPQKEALLTAWFWTYVQNVKKKVYVA